MKRVLELAARPCEIILGLLFVSAAALKGMDMHLFMGQIHGYGIESINTNATLLGYVALLATSSELFLGIAMILRLRIGYVVPLMTLGMLLFYTGLIAYARPEDCGCYGAVKVSWPMGIFKNLVMLLMGAVAWRGLLPSQEGAAADKRYMMKAAVSILPALLLFAWAYPTVFVKSEPKPTPTRTEAVNTDTAKTPEPPKPALPAGPFSEYVVVDQFGQAFDLSKGEHLVAMLSMTCEHCMESVPTLNAIYNDPTLPPLVAIVYEPEPGSYDSFDAQTFPEFPMHNLGEDFLSFTKLIGGAPPRLSHVINGQPAQQWDTEIPGAEEIVAALAGG